MSEYETTIEIEKYGDDQCVILRKKRWDVPLIGNYKGCIYAVIPFTNDEAREMALNLAKEYEQVINGQFKAEARAEVLKEVREAVKKDFMRLIDTNVDDPNCFAAGINEGVRESLNEIREILNSVEGKK